MPFVPSTALLNGQTGPTGPTGPPGPAGGGASPPDYYTLAAGISVGDTTFTLDREPTNAAIGTGWFVIEPFTTNCEIRRVTSRAGAVVTPTVGITATSAAYAFVAATKRITGASEDISRFFPGQTIAITGSVSNNGTFTVDDYPADGSYDGTYITVNETVVDETAGASVTIKVNLRAHANGSAVFFTEGPIPVTWYGARASASTADATTNRLAFQRAFDDAYYAQCWDLYVPGFMAGRYFIDAPLYIEKLTHLRGAHHKSAIIAAHTTFPVWNDDVAILQTRRNGLVCNLDNGGNDRYYLTGIGLDGLDVAYLKSPGFTNQNVTGTGYSATGTNTFAIHATLVPGNASYSCVFRALAGGTAGNAIRVAYVNDGPSTALSVSVSGNDITVHLATDGSSVVTSTGADIATAVNAHAPAAALVECSVLDTGDDRSIIAVAFAMTALTAGTEPFVSGDIGRSIYIGQREGARNITAFTNGYTVTVDGGVFTASYAGRKWVVSPINGLLGSYNQTSRIIDVRIDDCPGYNMAVTGAQELTVHNYMSGGGGIHIRIMGSQFCRFYESNFEKSVDAFVTFEPVSGSDLCRSIHFIGTHLEGDSVGVDAFRNVCTTFESVNWLTNYWTVHPGSTFLKMNAGTALGTYSVLGMSFGGPNTGPVFLDDASRAINIPMTAYGIGNNFTVPIFSAGNEILTNRRVQSKTTTYQVLLTDKLVKADATGGAFTVTLPTALGCKGMEFTVKRMNSGANAVSVDGSGAETIDGSGAAVSLAAQYDRITVMSDGSNWQRID